MRASQFDVAIVDLCWGECAHAFAATVLGLPIIAYWPHSPGNTNLGCSQFINVTFAKMLF